MSYGKTIRAVLVDVDGTLVPADSLDFPTPKVTQTILATRNKVTSFGLATSRQPEKALHLIRHLHLTGLSILVNGGMIFDNVREQELVTRTIDTVATLDICRWLNDHHPDFWIQDNGIDTKYTSEYRPNRPFIILAHKASPAIVTKISEFIATFDPITSMSNREYPDGTFDILITHKQSNKAAAVAEVASRLGITPQMILGIGDGLNDLPFITSCGIGIALANGADPVKKAADFVAPSVSDDGVAVALNKYLPL